MEQRIAIATRAEVPERGAKKFSFEREGEVEEGFLIRYKGRFFAYRNICSHIPLKMDQETGLFFGSAGTSLVCRNHGAVFDPLTGKCLMGPPKGKYLRWLSIAVSGDVIYLILRDARPTEAPATCAADCPGEGSAS
jgi:nitrite reductase/ring-hydroxylating ferredoxin subunit